MTSEAASQGWGAGGVERVDECPVCRHDHSQVVHARISDMEEGVAGLWDMRMCESCGSLFLDPRPTVDSIGMAYESYYTHSPPTTENAILSDHSWAGRIARGYLCARYGMPRLGDELSFVGARLRPLRQQLDYFMRLLPSVKGRVLDIGCGSGGFIQRATSAGWIVEGVEPDPKAAATARAAGAAELYRSIEEVPRVDFDVVTLSHVIEHLHGPADFLVRIRELLGPGGRIWVAIPNVAGLGRRLYGDTWQALEVPRHLSIPSASGLRSLLSESGFGSIEFRCRGRGSAKRFDANEMRRAGGGSRLRAAAAALVVDAAATFSPYAAEELVVTATVSP